jgi:hypothetical protein
VRAVCEYAGEPSDEADRGRHPGFARHESLAGGPGSLSLSFDRAPAHQHSSSTMGLDYTFHVEHHQDGQWTVPPNLLPPPRFSHPGEFLWLSRHSPARDLFFGDGALFPFISGPPPDWTSSLLFQYFSPWYDFKENEWQISWIRFEDLLVDDWAHERLLLRNLAKSQYVHWFGDGSQPFPHQQFLNAGLSEWDVFKHYHESVTHVAVDRTWGRSKFEIEQAGPDFFFDVTWSATIAQAIGEQATSDFRSLRKFGSDAELRVISTYS